MTNSWTSFPQPVSAAAAASSMPPGSISRGRQQLSRLTVGSSSTDPTHISYTIGIITDSSNWSADACNTTLEQMKVNDLK